jgi:hypothetical protein
MERQIPYWNFLKTGVKNLVMTVMGHIMYVSTFL